MKSIVNTNAIGRTKCYKLLHGRYLFFDSACFVMLILLIMEATLRAQYVGTPIIVTFSGISGLSRN